MNPESWQKRLLVFIRSVIPADPAQLLFLLGIVCLLFAPRMSWWPAQLNASLSRLGIDDHRVRIESLIYFVFEEYAFLFAASAGYFVCFRPGPRPFRRVFFFVVLPAVAAFGSIFIRFDQVGSAHLSVLTRSLLGGPFQAMQWTNWTSSPGFHTAFVGFLLIGIFASRMIFGIASLPLELPDGAIARPPEPQLWGRLQFLMWALLGPLFLVDVILGVGLVAIASGTSQRFIDLAQSPWLVTFLTPVEGLAILLIAYWLVGSTGRAIIRSSIRPSHPIYLLLASAISIGIAVSVSIGHFVIDRLIWVRFHFGDFTAPQFHSYFNLPNAWLLLAFFGAFFEEVVFRGLLQTVFVRRYGLYRGIFLVSVIWAAYHFNSDASLHFTEWGALSQVAFRLFTSLSLGFVLSWVALHSGSIIPAAIAHTFYNVLLMNFGPSFIGKTSVQVTLWAILAYILFRYWPVQIADEPEIALAIPDPEPSA